MTSPQFSKRFWHYFDSNPVVLRILFVLVWVYIGATHAFASTAQAVHLVAFVGDAMDQKPPVAVIRVGYGTSAAIKPSAIAISGDPANLQKTSLYHLFASKDGSREEIPLARVRLSGIDSSSETASEVDLVPKAMLKADYSYTVEVAGNTLPLATGFVHDDKKDALDVDPKELSAELDYLHMRTLENKAELSQGKNLGTGSFRYTYRYYSPPETTRYTFVPKYIELVGSGDFDFISQDNHTYFNSLTAQLSGLWLDTWKLNDDFRGAYYWGINGSVESDQDFDTVDSTVGAVIKVHVKNIISTTLHDAILDLTSHGTATDGTPLPGRMLDAGVAPLFTVGYDYVGHVKRSAGTNTGNQRLTAGFVWDLPLARSFTLLSLTPNLDADFLVNLGYVYDTDMGEFHDNSKLVLDIHQHAAKDDGFSFTLTYAQGEMTPKYQHVSALLAGFKKPF